ncbi:coiled-coil domain-containing protein 87-like isoform X2 [Physella acuta]|uniref:coiled-coil domain-containing protein 87-like isoform X2 n=1 Tax=Physella acuta TaxID=109671 RepID=UPI0027DB3FA2|nr:coiled-coil domain-containing protein 87-like isoform X2 [Physella acuta]
MPSTFENQYHAHSSQFGRLPKYASTASSKPEKVDDMYPLQWTGFANQADVQTRIQKVLGPLSLFAPFTNEDVPEPTPIIQLDRPVTPINEEIKTQPQSLDVMVSYVRRRIMPKPDIPFLSTEDQRNLAAIILGEVNSIWPEIRRQIDDPFLSAENNKELNRRITVHIVTVCEQLFNHYLSKAQVLNERGVFSGPANMSRLKAQLALETNELLNILKIRRYIVQDIKTSAAQQDNGDEASNKEVTQVRAVSGKKLTYQALMEVSRPKTRQHSSALTNIDRALKEIQDNMPVLDTSQLMDLIPDFPDRSLQTPSEEDFYQKTSYKATDDSSLLNGILTEEGSNEKVVFRRSNSQPLLVQGEGLMEELGIDKKVKTDALMQHELGVLKRERDLIVKVKPKTLDKKSIKDGNSYEKDLKKLSEYKVSEVSQDDDDEDLPPLIQAITRHARHDDLKQRMEKQLKELEDKEKLRREEECVHVRGPTYPQPDTVNAKLGKTGVVRTSDIRVSERVCMSSITLKRYATVYNDLLEEIDPTTVKNLDKKLFLSSEVQEVYKEIMKTASTSHLELDDDPLVLNAPESLNISGTMASTSLSKKVVDRVINPSFSKEKSPPWGDTELNEWVKTPVNPPKNFLGEDLFQPVAPNMPKVYEVINNPAQTAQMVVSPEGIPTYVADKTSSSYSSWLQWWKSTVTSEDYMKYLSTLETDYMGAIFHFYDSDEESEPEDVEIPYKLRRTKQFLNSGKNKVTPQQKEKMRKLAELQNIKSEYKQGFWNANSVLMGGLGKDPSLNEDDPPEAESAAKTKLNDDKVGESKNLLTKRLLSSHLTKRNVETPETVASRAKTAEDVKKVPDAQDRLENVWQSLQVPDSQRLDMAIKYSCNEYFSQLSEAIEGWEYVSNLILQREKLLIDLEKFERQASDPNRFFHKDSKKSSNRLKESKQRSHLYRKIDELDVEIKEEVEFIRSKFQDVITFKGRPYIDKMKWDRTEMLYWLAEERKQNGIKYEVLTRGLTVPLKPAQLQPISTTKIV